MVKHILKYPRRMRDYMLVYSSEDLTPLGYMDSDFQSDRDSKKSTSRSVLLLEEASLYEGASNNLVLLTQK